MYFTRQHFVCRYLVSQHPEVERKIAEELQGLGLLGTPEQPRPRPLQWDDLPKLHYLGCAMKATLHVVLLFSKLFCRVL